MGEAALNPAAPQKLRHILDRSCSSPWPASSSPPSPGRTRRFGAEGLRSAIVGIGDRRSLPPAALCWHRPIRLPADIMEHSTQPKWFSLPGLPLAVKELGNQCSAPIDEVISAGSLVQAHNQKGNRRDMSRQQSSGVRANTSPRFVGSVCNSPPHGSTDQHGNTSFDRYRPILNLRTEFLR